MDELDPSWAKHLPANNLDARLSFARIFSERVSIFAEAIGPGERMFFVTLIVGDHTVREDEAVEFDVKRVQGVAHHWLRECDFLGIVEGAYFTNFKVTGLGFDRAVSWHMHAIVWGITEAALKALIRKFNSRYRTKVSGIAAGHYSVLDPNEAAIAALYMAKGQIASYKIWPRKYEFKDKETGEITIEGTGRFSQGKYKIRSGEMARMYRVFEGRYLDQLAFAGGDGGAILAAVKKAARLNHAKRSLPLIVSQRRHIAVEAESPKRRVEIVVPFWRRKR